MALLLLLLLLLLPLVLAMHAASLVAFLHCRWPFKPGKQRWLVCTCCAEVTSCRQICAVPGSASWPLEWFSASPYAVAPGNAGLHCQASAWSILEPLLVINQVTGRMQHCAHACP